MDEAVLKKALLELNQAITALPVARSRAPESGVYVSDAPQTTVEESVDLLRLQVKYLLFDLEATRRENRYLRQLIDNRPKPPKEEPGESF